jgi:hypothetical protein
VAGSNSGRRVRCSPAVGTCGRARRRSRSYGTRRRLRRRKHDLYDSLKLRDEGGPKLALQMPLYPEAKMPFETRAGVENVSGGMWTRPACCSLYGELALAGNDITYVHYPELPHGFIQMTAHSRRCLEATQELARLLGEALRKPGRRATTSRSPTHRRPEICRGLAWLGALSAQRSVLRREAACPRRRGNRMKPHNFRLWLEAERKAPGASGVGVTPDTLVNARYRRP